jgi:hypothetical protein
MGANGYQEGERHPMVVVNDQILGKTTKQKADGSGGAFGKSGTESKGVRWMPFTGQVGPLKSLTLDGWDRVRPQYRPLGEFCLPGSYGVLHGNTSRGSGPG